MKGNHKRGLRCGDCQHMTVEHWGEVDAMRCWNKENGEWYGRVTELFKAGYSPPVRSPAPAWCVLGMKRKAG